MKKMILQTRSKKHFFTLLELMICLVVISLTGTLLVIKGTDLLAYHQFQTSLQTFLLDVQRLRILCMTRDVDVTCRIQKMKGKYFVFLEDENESFSFSYELKEANLLFWEGKNVDQIELTILSSGRIFPSGCLKIESLKKKAYSIDFSYPLTLLPENFKKSPFVELPPYPDEVQKNSSPLKA